MAAARVQPHEQRPNPPLLGTPCPHPQRALLPFLCPRCQTPISPHTSFSLICCCNLRIVCSWFFSEPNSSCRGERAVGSEAGSLSGAGVEGRGLDGATHPLNHTTRRRWTITSIVPHPHPTTPRARERQEVGKKIRVDVCQPARTESRNPRELCLDLHPRQQPAAGMPLSPMALLI